MLPAFGLASGAAGDPQRRRGSGHAAATPLPPVGLTPPVLAPPLLVPPVREPPPLVPPPAREPPVAGDPPLPADDVFGAPATAPVPAVGEPAAPTPEPPLPPVAEAGSPGSLPHASNAADSVTANVHGAALLPERGLRSSSHAAWDFLMNDRRFTPTPYAVVGPPAAGKSVPAPRAPSSLHLSASAESGAVSFSVRLDRRPAVSWHFELQLLAPYRDDGLLGGSGVVHHPY